MGAAYGFNDDHVKAIEEILKSSSERIAAIVGVTILDGTLRKTLEERLRDDKDGANLLFKSNRPLGNTGRRLISCTCSGRLTNRPKIYATFSLIT
jgi:hypothetical protein